MKKFFSLIVCAVLYTAGASAQTSETTPLYIINGEKITAFDGSQLRGKTVTGYRVINSEKDGKPRTIHLIDTSDSKTPAQSSTNVSVSGDTTTVTTCRVIRLNKDGKPATGGTDASADGNKKTVSTTSVYVQRDSTGTTNPIIIIDGKRYEGKLDDIDISMIKSIDVYKADSYKAKQFDEEGKTNVMVVNLKKGTDDFILFVNGKRVTRDEMEKLPPEKIKSANVYKAGTKKAIEMAGEDGKKRSVLSMKVKE